MAETHPTRSAGDDFDNRIPPEEREDFVAGRPHEDAVFDWMWWSRHGRETGGNGPSAEGWRFVYACEHYPERCPDAIGDMAACKVVEEPHPNIPRATRLRIMPLVPDRHPAECPDCGGPVFRLSREWAVPMRPAPPAAPRAGSEGGR